MNDCIFCRIAAGEIPSDKLFEDDTLIAFRDLAPQAPVHVLIVPKQHIESVNALTSDDLPLVGHIYEVARSLAETLNLSAGYRIVTNVGKDGGQSVMHLHFHLLGGREFGWPPG